MENKSFEDYIREQSKIKESYLFRPHFVTYEHFEFIIDSNGWRIRWRAV